MKVETIEDIKNVKAIKKHKCSFCGGTINNGDTYQKGVFKTDYVYTWKNHLHCSALVNKIQKICFFDINTQEAFEESIEIYFAELSKLNNTECKKFSFDFKLKWLLNYFKIPYDGKK